MMTMKKILYIMLCLLPLVSCSQKKEVTGDVRQDVIFVTISDQTKTQLGTSGKLSWTAGDRIAVFSDNVRTPEIFSLRSGEGFSVASFSGTKPEGNIFFAFYPSDARCDGVTIRTELPVEIHHSAPVEVLGDMPLFGMSDDVSDIKVRNICGVLQFNLTGNGKLKSVVLSSQQNAIAGDFLYSFADDIYAMGRTASHTITLDASSTELSPFRPAPFYFILPPGEYEDLKFTVTDADGISTVFSTGEVIAISPGKITEAKSAAPEVDLLSVKFIPEKNLSGCFWYTEITKNPSFCVSYLFGIATKKDFESYGSDAASWLEDNGRLCTASTVDMQVLTPETEYVAMARATSVSGSQEKPVVMPFTTPALKCDESMAVSVTTSDITGKSVAYEVVLPSGVEYLSEVAILPAAEFDTASPEELIVEALATRQKGRSLTGSFDGLLPGIDYVVYCIGDNGVSISKLAISRFTTVGNKIGGETEDIEEIDVK